MTQIASKTVTSADQATGVDISGITGDVTLLLRVDALSAASGTPRARIVLEDSVNAFTNSLPVCEYNIEGPIAAPVQVSWRRYQTPSLRNGVASAVLRVNVAALEGTSPSLTYTATLL